MADPPNYYLAERQRRVSLGMIDRQQERVAALLKARQITPAEHDERQAEVERRRGRCLSSRSQ